MADVVDFVEEVGGVFYVRGTCGDLWLEVMVKELGNALHRRAYARDYRTTRMTLSLFVYIWYGVKTPWLRRVFFEVLC